MNVIECRQLSKVYVRKQALSDLSFSIREHTITGLIGRNGAGKTTLLKLIAGFYRPTSGEVSVFSERPFNSLKVSQNMIYVDDQMALPTTMNLQEILTMTGRFYPFFDRGLADRLLDYFSIHVRAHHQDLSKGLRSTFNMILGLAARCPLTILDEPTTGMDVAVRKDFYRALLKEYLAHPRTIIISSHLLQELDHMLEDVVLIDQGKLRLHLPIDELKQYAVGIVGHPEQLEPLLAGREVFHQDLVSTSRSLVIVRNDGYIHEAAVRHGLEIVPISAEDICVYMTKQTKGRIDDVFIRSE